MSEKAENTRRTHKRAIFRDHVIKLNRALQLPEYESKIRPIFRNDVKILMDLYMSDQMF